MCGIAGRYLTASVERDPGAEETLLQKMSQALKHRGPDDSGVAWNRGVGLAFARLSIIDLSGGHQPMEYADGRYAIVFNGEIYNFEQLRRELEGMGFRFATNSDTEVLLALYAKHGRQLLDRLNGMFAFAIHDRGTGEIFLARDRLGIKPLYYSLGPAGLFFSSEVKALRLCPEISLELDPQALREYLSYGHIPAPGTVYRSVRTLPPGHWLVFDGSSFKMERYWRVTAKSSPHRSLAEASESLFELLKDSVRLRMISDVPLGAFLSGGIDSGLISSVMSLLSERPVRTFSVGFAEADFDEREAARRVASKYGTDHQEIVCTDDMRDLVPMIATAFDQPFADSSALPTYLVCREARKYATVVLSGDGGDECFAGYNRHSVFAEGAGEHGFNPLLKWGAGKLAALVDPLSRGAQRLNRASLNTSELQLDGLTLIDGRVRNRLAGDRLRRIGRSKEFRDRWLEEQGRGNADRLQAMQLLEFELYLPGDILEKVDKMSMLNSLEVRVPFLDHRIVEFGLSLSSGLKNDGQRGKLILRELGKTLLPAGHLERPKVGFAIPIDEWMRSGLRELVQDNLRPSRVAEDGWLNQRIVDKIIDLQRRGRPWGPVVWTLLVLELWYRSVSSN